MVNLLQNLRDERERLKKRIKLLDLLIADYESTGKPTSLIGGAEKEGKVAAVPGKRRGAAKKEKTLEIIKACTLYLERTDSGLSNQELLRLLSNDGMEIVAQRPDASLRSMLLRSGEFWFDSERKVWFKKNKPDLPYGPAA